MLNHSFKSPTIIPHFKKNGVNKCQPKIAITMAAMIALADFYCVLSAIKHNSMLLCQFHLLILPSQVMESKWLKWDKSWPHLQQTLRSSWHMTENPWSTPSGRTYSIKNSTIDSVGQLLLSLSFKFLLQGRQRGHLCVLSTVLCIYQKADLKKFQPYTESVVYLLRCMPGRTYYSSRPSRFWWRALTSGSAMMLSLSRHGSSWDIYTAYLCCAASGATVEEETSC